MHWYWIYLARAQRLTETSRGGGSSSATVLAWIGRLLLAPQLVLLLYTSLAVAPHQLSLALFVQTFLFVAHNKVITAQYFTWYLCLLPLSRDRFCFAHRRVQTALVGSLGSVVLWLGTAYCLEMRGLAVHFAVWWASVVVFAANVNLLGALLASTTKGVDLLLLPNQKAKAD
jgi:phosphatidylinositol glycan class M